MHIKLKDGKYWVWSSKKASLDCIPWFKCSTFQGLKEYCRNAVN